MAPSLTLYGGFHGTRLSPYVEKVARACELKRLEFELVDVRSPFEVRRWSPVTGKVPVLDLDGERLWDSTFILRRLDEIRPDPPLYAADPELRARQELLEEWSDEGLYWLVMALRWAEPNKQATVRQILGRSVPGPLVPLLGRVLERVIGGQVRAQGTGRLPYGLVLRETGRALDRLVELLGGGPFFHTERPGAADLAIFGQLQAGASEATPDFRDLLHDRPALVDFTKRVEDATPPRPD